MNNKHILDLTLRLSQALDQNYDVVSMETVLLVISALEGTTITKEQLEATRLAKYINQLRRRTKCEKLARRAKSLLKKWREMVGIQQSNDSSTAASCAANATATSAINSSSTATTPFNIPVSDNAISTSHLQNQQFSHQNYQRQQQCQSIVKQQQLQQQPSYSQPSSPNNLQEKSNPNDFLISMSNPATGTQMPKCAKTNLRKKRKLEKNVNNEPIAHQQPQPTSFANLITGLGSTFSSSRKTVASTAKPVETFLIEHSSNSNSDLICIPSTYTVSCNITSARNIPSVVIDLQDTNSSMNSLMSKDVTLHPTKISSRKFKNENMRMVRNLSSHQNQPLQDCDDHNTTTMPYYYKRPSDVLLLDEKSNSACPTISNISEILSLSNSSLSLVFPSADAMSKNVFQSEKNELVSSSGTMTKSDLTFAGKFKHNTSSTSTGCNVLNYNSDSTNVNILNDNPPNRKKFSLFGGMDASNSNDSSSSSRTTPFRDVVLAVKAEATNSRHNTDNVIVKHNVNEKTASNMSNKGNSSTDNTIAADATTNAGATKINFSSQLSVKEPKKRGRKKGSKGFDSVIAKETSLSSQMLLSSFGMTGKKVKTTKELYAEMENRKLRNQHAKGLEEMAGNASVNWQQQQTSVGARCPSVCSDINESDSCTMTSEQSRDSGNMLIKSAMGKSDTPLDNNSSYLKQGFQLKTGDIKSDEVSKPLTDKNSALEITTKIKFEIQEILKLLTPPRNVKEIEHECFSSMTPCTCAIEEVTTSAHMNESIGNNDDKDLNFNATKSTNISTNNRNDLKLNIVLQTNVEDNLNLTGKDQKSALSQPPQPGKAKKSIFDLDFNYDEDPLHSIIADIERKNIKSKTEITSCPPVIEDKSVLPLSTKDDLGKVDHQNEPHALNVPASYSDDIIIPSYKLKFDADCKARNRFDIQTQKITKFHIDTLHNCFIPNVNGNWNHADAVHNRIKREDNHHNKSGLNLDGYNVVPFYGSDINEKIVKNLSHVKFSTKLKVGHSKCENKSAILFYIPFLGVSRILASTKLRSKGIRKLKLEEEKENVENKLILNNIIPNTTALDTTDAKETEEYEMGMESVQEVEKSPSKTIKLKLNKNIKKTGFKRFRKHATLVKRSTIKRLKLTADGDLEINKSDENDSDNIEEFKLHRLLFYREEICPVVKNDDNLYKEHIFHISSCSSGCSSADEETTNESANCRKHTTSTSSTSSPSSPSSSEYHMLNLQQEIIQAELAKRSALHIENNQQNESDPISRIESIEDDKVSSHNDDDGDENNVKDTNDLPMENNGMLLSFNSIYNKFTRDQNAEQQNNKDHENNMLKQQLQNCDDYNNLNNNINLIKYIDNKTSSFNNINNNNNYSCSNYYTDININSSSSYSHENSSNNLAPVYHPQQHQLEHSLSRNDDFENYVKIKPFKEYQTGLRAVDEDVNDDDGNNCGRLQKFKEWHEVLQLRSYNDELLTVLPYVVLE